MFNLFCVDDGWSATERIPGERNSLLIQDVTLSFHWVPPGRFQMGSPYDEEGRCDDESPRNVALTRGFWVAESSVSQGLWSALGYTNQSGDVGYRLPVTYVSWRDAHEFIARLNVGGYAPNGWEFALPTEAQWEYACRAGTTTPFSFGRSLNGDNANCDGRRPYGATKRGKILDRTTQPGTYPPNQWGLYDMHGNVWEWCEDAYAAYLKSETVDPIQRSSSSPRELRVVRGGSWRSYAKDCRSACRYARDPVGRYKNVGFRLILSSK